MNICAESEMVAQQYTAVCHEPTFLFIIVNMPTINPPFLGDKAGKRI